MIFSWDDIVIIGDSFAADRSNKTDWPQHLTLELTTHPYSPTQLPRGKGYFGAAWWSTRKELLKQLDQRIPKILVICHTDALRIPHDRDLALNCYTSYFKGNKTKHIDSSHHAAYLYFNHLISIDYHFWSQLQWFKELDNILDQYSIPYIIHLPIASSEHDTLLDPINEKMRTTSEQYQFRNGVTTRQHLLALATKIVDPTLALRNHFTEEQNLNLANSLIKIINNYPGQGLVDL